MGYHITGFQEEAKNVSLSATWRRAVLAEGQVPGCGLDLRNESRLWTSRTVHACVSPHPQKAPDTPVHNLTPPLCMTENTSRGPALLTCQPTGRTPGPTGPRGTSPAWTGGKFHTAERTWLVPVHRGPPARHACEVPQGSLGASPSTNDHSGGKSQSQLSVFMPMNLI